MYMNNLLITHTRLKQHFFFDQYRSVAWYFNHFFPNSSNAKNLEKSFYLTIMPFTIFKIIILSLFQDELSQSFLFAHSKYFPSLW